MILKDLYGKFGASLVKEPEFINEIRIPAKFKIARNIFNFEKSSRYDVSPEVKLRSILNSAVDIEKLDVSYQRMIFDKTLKLFQKYDVIRNDSDTSYITVDLNEKVIPIKESYFVMTKKYKGEGYDSNYLNYTNDIFVSKKDCYILTNIIIFIGKSLIKFSYHRKDDTIVFNFQNKQSHGVHGGKMEEVVIEMNDSESIEKSLNEYLKHRLYHILYNKRMKDAFDNESLTYDDFTDENFNVYQAIKF